VAVIAPDNDATISAMLRLPKQGASWWLEQWQARERWIDARYRALGGAWAIVRLLGRDEARRVPAQLPTRATPRFVIVVLRHARGAELEPLLDRIAATVQAHEQRFRWAEPKSSPKPDPTRLDPRSVPVERLAVKAGVKPALRIRLYQWEAPYEVGLWLREGFAVTAVETDAGADGARTYVMVARTRAHVDALADAELRQFLPMPAQLDALRECGELLGYPPCCVEAFVRSTELEEGRDAELDSRRCNFHRLDAAWVPLADARLNTLRQHESLGLISFDPCSFACPAALAAAEGIAEVVEAAHPGYVELLRGSFAINHDDDRVALELEPGPAGGARVRAATATRANAEGFAARLLGCCVDEDGRVPELDEPCRVFRFA
jgi:hypothetical protein